MKTLHQIAKENGFQFTVVTAEEHEDGVGTCVGDNWILGQVFHTTNEMIQVIGLPKFQIKTVNLDAKAVGSLEKAKRMAIEWLEEQPNITYYDIFRCKYGYNNSAICIAIMYG